MTPTRNGRKAAAPDTIKSINPRTGEVLREIETTPIEEIPLVVEREAGHACGPPMSKHRLNRLERTPRVRSPARSTRTSLR